MYVCVWFVCELAYMLLYIYICFHICMYTHSYSTCLCLTSSLPPPSSLIHAFACTYVLMNSYPSLTLRAGNLTSAVFAPNPSVCLLCWSFLVPFFLHLLSALKISVLLFLSLSYCATLLFALAFWTDWCFRSSLRAACCQYR